MKNEETTQTFLIPLLLNKLNVNFFMFLFTIGLHIIRHRNTIYKDKNHFAVNQLCEKQRLINFKKQDFTKYFLLETIRR
mgnify:CR=1 FL=1